jgi:hypothetical protein
MSGERFLLDTNAIVALLRAEHGLPERLMGASWVGISIISRIEFLVFSGLVEADRSCFDEFLRRVEVIGMDGQDAELIESIIRLRRSYRLKLPDAIIAASALREKATLVSADAAFSRVTELTLEVFGRPV